MDKSIEMKEKIIEMLKAAYHWGRDNGEGRSDKNFNDFLNTSIVSNLEPLINQEEEKRIAERMPSIDHKSWFMTNCRRQRKVGAKICQCCPFRAEIERQERSLLMTQKTEGGGE